MKRLLIALIGVLATGMTFAQPTPLGLWKVIDDATKKEQTLVRIVESSGVLTGKVEKFLDPTILPNATCDECKDERKGRPILGMAILENVHKNTDKAGLWDGGQILDPGNGKTYKVRLTPIDGGKKMEVRGYIGAPMFGRTQVWVRAE